MFSGEEQPVEERISEPGADLEDFSRPRRVVPGIDEGLGGPVAVEQVLLVQVVVCVTRIEIPQLFFALVFVGRAMSGFAGDQRDGNYRAGEDAEHDTLIGHPRLIVGALPDLAKRRGAARRGGGGLFFDPEALLHIAEALYGGVHAHRADLVLGMSVLGLAIRRELYVHAGPDAG